MKGFQLIEIPIKKDQRGNLAIIEQWEEIPFEIKRIFWIFDVPTDGQRAAHAHKELSQFITGIAGSFRIKLDDGERKESVILDSPGKGLLISPGIWISLTDFSKDAVCLVVAPGDYNEGEYIKDYQEFLRWKRDV